MTTAPLHDVAYDGARHRVFEFLRRTDNVFADAADCERLAESMLILGLVRSNADPYGTTYEITESGYQFFERELQKDLYENQQRTSEFPLVTVIVPVYNEEQTIGDVVSRLVRLQRIRKEIIVVDDGSTDGTPRVLAALELLGKIVKVGGKEEVKPVVKQYNEFPSIRILHHEGNRGKGAALRTGLACGHGEIFVVQDADLEYSPENIEVITHPIAIGEADVVFGSRILGSCVGMSLSHRVGNWILSGMTSLLFSRRVSDVMTGHKAFSRRALRGLTWDEDGFAAEIGITAAVLANKQLKFTEVPIPYEYRLIGRSKIRLRDGLTSLLRLIRLRIRPLKVDLKEVAETQAELRENPSLILEDKSRREK